MALRVTLNNYLSLNLIKDENKITGVTFSRAHILKQI